MIDVRIPPAFSMFERINHGRSLVSVAVSMHNYEDVVLEALESVRHQDLPDIDLVVVDDHSTDASQARVREWMESHARRFGRVALLQHASNQGLAVTRNQGFGVVTTPFVFVLDADNALYPRCLNRCLEVAHSSAADAVYTILEVFGDVSGLMGTDEWDPVALRRANYVDAMALVRQRAWADVGGYRKMPVSGWEDYDFWLKFAERGMSVVRLPEILGRYRHRDSSMLRRITNRPETRQLLVNDMRLHHPGLLLD